MDGAVFPDTKASELTPGFLIEDFLTDAQIAIGFKTTARTIKRWRRLDKFPAISTRINNQNLTAKSVVVAHIQSLVADGAV